MSEIAIEYIQPWGTAVGIEGVSMFGFEYAMTYIKKQSFYNTIAKMLKQYTDPVLALAISLVSIAFINRQGKTSEMVNRAIRVIGSYGVYKALAITLKQHPVVMITDASTIEAWGLDANANVNVYVDGSQVSFTTQPTTDGNGYVKITLPSPLVTGTTHKVLVETGFKSAFVEQYI